MRVSRFALPLLTVLSACARHAPPATTCAERTPAPAGMIRVDGPCAWADRTSLLLVLDGVPVGPLRGRTASRVMARLDPGRIQSILLKDAGSGREYGPAGANGVMLVTTTPGS